MQPRPTELLRPGLLDGLVVARAGGAEAVAAACAPLGAATPALDADPLDEPAVTAAAEALGRVDTLVCDTAPAFAAAGLRAALDGAWNATRAVVNAALRPAGGGKVVLLAPAPAAGEHAGAVAAALENLARTLSVEWARYGIRPTAVLPGDATVADEVALLAAYLASPAGDYFSGCAFRLGAVAGSSAQGTSTESSVGASRATTYSAGSSAEGFSSTWVSRGGT
jgi:NAD(P)-dependent dehydrogenase (short-subunit alcohol dehydrogenase family)